MEIRAAAALFRVGAGAAHKPWVPTAVFNEAVWVRGNLFHHIRPMKIHGAVVPHHLLLRKVATDHVQVLLPHRCNPHRWLGVIFHDEDHIELAQNMDDTLEHHDVNLTKIDDDRRPLLQAHEAIFGERHLHLRLVRYTAEAGILEGDVNLQREARDGLELCAELLKGGVQLGPHTLLVLLLQYLVGIIGRALPPLRQVVNLGANFSEKLDIQGGALADVDGRFQVQVYEDDKGVRAARLEDDVFHLRVQYFDLLCALLHGKSEAVAVGL
mmetsp:Transcript_39113/g.112989  ORF Transcript_39113/g.112989 Transcript_39113/m.112989 type:complete len:269 (-) Transcript_39113:1763-2569(-)